MPSRIDGRFTYPSFLTLSILNIMHWIFGAHPTKKKCPLKISNTMNKVGLKYDLSFSIFMSLQF